MEKLYTIYNPETSDVLFAAMFSEKPDNATEAMVTEIWAKPKYNPETDDFYNAATEEEQDEYLRKRNLAFAYNQMWIDNDSIIETQSSHSLDEKYPDAPIDFVVFAKNVNGGTKYHKTQVGWKKEEYNLI